LKSILFQNIIVLTFSIIKIMIKLKQREIINFFKMSDIYVTRFTDETWSENVEYCRKKYDENVKKIIYNTPIMISKNVPYNSDIIVVEMNNSTNKILGLSIVKNRIKGTHNHKMYSENNYNRYSYYGYKRIPVEEMTEFEKEVILFLESICFKGKTHIKRGQGMSKINDVMFIKCRYILDVPLYIKKMFRNREKQNKNTLILKTSTKESNS